jgi:hypothetical protein
VIGIHLSAVALLIVGVALGVLAVVSPGIRRGQQVERQHRSVPSVGEQSQ